MASIVFRTADGKPPGRTRCCRAVGRALFALAERARRLGLRRTADRLACRGLVIVQAGERHRLGLPLNGGSGR